MNDEQRIDSKIDSKIKALAQLTDELNHAQDEFNSRMAALDASMETRTQEYIAQLAKLEEGLVDPERSLQYMHDDLDLRENQLGQWSDELNSLRDVLDSREEILTQKEEEIAAREERLTTTWADFARAASHSILEMKRMVENRAETLEKREELLRERQNTLNDRIRTQRAAQQEILNIEHG